MTAPDVASSERDHRRFSETQSDTSDRYRSTRRPDLVRIPAERSPLARFSDPDTSHDAGNSQTAEVLNARQVAVLAALHRYGPMTDEQIIARLDAMRVLDDSIPNSTAQAFRTARKALQSAGRIVDSQRREHTAAGRTAIVWELSAALVPQP